ncbi:T9SS type A sorting domain-containing protein [Bizionia sp. KMM 8389]
MTNKTYYLIIFLMLFGLQLGFSQSVSDVPDTKQESETKLAIYPNPVSDGKLYVVTSNNFAKQVAIYTVLGKKILSTTFMGKILDISKIKPGIYIIKVTENNISATRKLIVK